MNRRVTLAVLSAALLMFGQSAIAHHALSANYDTDKIGTIEGVVVEVFWSNPHVHYYMEVENEAGETELWDIETSNLANLMRTGWSRDRIEVGDRIRISGHLGRNGTKRLELDRESLEQL